MDLTQNKAKRAALWVPSDEIWALSQPSGQGDEIKISSGASQSQVGDRLIEIAQYFLSFIPPTTPNVKSHLHSSNLVHLSLPSYTPLTTSTPYFTIILLIYKVKFSFWANSSSKDPAHGYLCSTFRTRGHLCRPGPCFITARNDYK